MEYLVGSGKRGGLFAQAVARRVCARRTALTARRSRLTALRPAAFVLAWRTARRAKVSLVFALPTASLALRQARGTIPAEAGAVIRSRSPTASSTGVRRNIEVLSRAGNESYPP